MSFLQYRASQRRSGISSFLQPQSYAFPISIAEVEAIQIRMVPIDQIKKTFAGVMRVQDYFPPIIILKIVIFVLFFISALYLSILLILFALFNPIGIGILVTVLYNLLTSIKTRIRTQIKIHRRKKLKQWLQAQNRRYYSKKLIRWEFSQETGQIVSHNLRLAH